MKKEIKKSEQIKQEIDSVYNKWQNAKTRDEEIQLLYSDTEKFQNTKNYIALFLDFLFERIETISLSSLGLEKVKNEILTRVPLAADLYLKNESDIEKEYSFSEYFLWHVEQIIVSAGAVQVLKGET